MKKLLLIAFVLIGISCQKESQKTSEVADKKEILTIMKSQEKAWSNHDLEGFMQGYWKNDSLKFLTSLIIGKF